MKSYIVITFLTPEEAPKVPGLFVLEKWTVRIAGATLTEAYEKGLLGCMSVFEVTSDHDTREPIRDRVRILLNEAGVRFISLFVGPSDGTGASWWAGNVSEEPLPTSWQRLENLEL